MSVLTHSTTSKTNWDFDPRSIPDCDIWFDAADTSTLTLTSTTVISWKNKGFLDMSAIQNTGTVTSGSTINGNNFLNIPAGAQLSFQCAISSAAGRTWFIVMRGQTQISTSQFFGPTNPTTSAQDAIILTRNGNTTYTIYESPNGNGTNFISANTIPNPFLTTSVYSVVHSATAANSVISVNGTEYARNVNGVAGGYSTSSLTYLIGASGYNTALDMCELLHYDRDLTRTERIAVEGYLMWKWGIKRQNEVGFTPTSISGCLAWYHSDVNYADTTSRSNNFTFSSGDLISSWKDMSGNGRDATFLNSSPSTTRPSLTSNQLAGKPVVIFNGANVLNSTLSLATTQPITVFLVAASNSLGSFRAAFSLNSYPGTRGSLLSMYQSGSNLWWFSGSTAGTDGNTSSIALVSGRYDILANYWNTTIRTQMNINGHYLPSSTSSPTSLIANSTMLIGGTVGTLANTSVLTELWSGGIAEIIVYNSVLSADDRNRIERYLSLKWNRPLVNACAIGHPNKWVPDFSRTFVPTDIADCCLWLDGADQSKIQLSGSTVTQWNDKSNSGYAGVFSAGRNFTYATGIRNGLGAIQTATGQTMTIANFALGSTMTVFHVYMPINQSTGSAFIEQGPDTNNNDGFYFFSQNNFNYAIRNGGTLTSTNFGTTAVSNTWEMITAVNKDTGASSLMAFYSNGALKSSGGNSLSNNTITNTLYINGRNNTNTLSYATYIGEIIIYRVALTPSQRKAVEGYLADKWGLRSTVTNMHPGYFGSAITDVVNFVPTSISGCRMWIDASDTTTINAGTITAGGTVTSLTDKSGTGLTLTVGGTPTWDYLFGKFPTINTTNGRFSGSFPSAITNFASTSFIVTLYTTNPTAGYPALAFGNAASSASRFMRALDWATTVRSFTFFSSTVGATLTAPGTNVPFLWTCTYDGSTSLNILYNSGSSSASAAPVAPGANATNFGIACEPFSPSLNANTWPGYISEIIVYNSVLSSTDRIRVEKYLARKWNLTQSILSANRFVNPVPIVGSPRIFPTTFADIALWLDAADPDADGIQPASGTKIGSWIDKSGNSRTCVQTVEAQKPALAYDGDYPGVLFTRSASQVLIGTPVMLSTNYGIFVVARSTTGSITSGDNDTVFFARKVTTAGAENYIRMTIWGRTGLSIYRSMQIYYTNATTSTSKVSTQTNPTNPTSPYLLTIIDDSVTTNSSFFYLNGALQTGSASGSTANVATDAEGYRLGATNLGGNPLNYLQGYIFEVIVVLHLPTTQERQLIEGYLAWKWGIQGSLPSSHPYSKVNP